MKDFKKLFSLLQPCRFQLTGVVFLNILSVLFSVFSIALLAPFLSLIFNTTPLITEQPVFRFDSESIVFYLKYLLSRIIASEGMTSALLFLILIIFSCFLLNKVFNYLAIWIMASVRSRIVQTYRNQMYDKLLTLPLSYYSRKKKGDIISRVINDVQDVDVSILQSVQQLSIDPLMMLFYLSALAFINFKLTLFVLLLLPVSGFIISRVQRKLRTVSTALKEKQGDMISSLEESIYGLRVIKAFHAIDRVYQQFKEHNQAYNYLYIKMFRRRDLSSPIGEFLGTITVTGILLYGSLLVFDATNGFSAELFITYIAMFVQVINPAKLTAESAANLKKGFAAMERIDELMQAEEVITEIPDAVSVDTFSDKIAFDHVYFSYGNNPVLNDLTFNIEKGKMLAVCGLSGAGKSTLTDLLMRFYDVSAGSILLDGQDIRTLNITSLRRLFGIVTQESILFNDTVYNNITLGMKDVSRKEVIHAAEIANACDFIYGLEHGFETNIGDRGIRLSGGQKQRISIARAILRNPPILILDEATSALDTESERMVQQAIDHILKNRTSVLIAHRLSTIIHADEIIVLDKGRIIEKGTHRQLSAQNGLYAQMITMQSL
ncbi:MAG: ABC transporter ATP-binding protein/permease, partial [Bacteroidales bacterium]|nr:ABC transporter ATP-binding protein/permease [Bacteroidales bacterium]